MVFHVDMTGTRVHSMSVICRCMDLWWFIAVVLSAVVDDEVSLDDIGPSVNPLLGFLGF